MNFFNKYIKRNAEMVYEIDLNKKYIMAFDDYIPDEQWEKIKSEMSRWLGDKERPILFIRGAKDNVKLIKVND